MSDFLYLIPVALGMGAIGLGIFLWSLRSGQYEDLDGAAERILFDDEVICVTRKRDSSTKMNAATTERLQAAGQHERTSGNAPFTSYRHK
jgi:cbb3-type cytochrome oxidase maturation protein